MVIDPKKLVLLDRDGVINIDSDAYVKSAEEWQAIPGSLEAIAALYKQGIQVIVVTNQSGIGRGYFSEATLQSMHEKLLNGVHELGGDILDIVFCPHKPDEGCDCRKPKPGMLEYIEQKYNISLAGVPLIGDTGKDMELAYKQSCLPILVKTGKGQGYFEEGFSSSDWFSQSLVFNSLSESCEYLLEKHFKQ
jgi:D-glycero-D-manno-heptose 1,7-bisphosphate phosphatase